MEKSDRKRPKADSESDESTLPPAYGSKEYWDDRYKRIKSDNGKDTAATPDPFHAWYFNWEELAPLILPLILGDPKQSDDQRKTTPDSQPEVASDEKSNKESEANRSHVRAKNSYSGQASTHSRADVDEKDKMGTADGDDKSKGERDDDVDDDDDDDEEEEEGDAKENDSEDDIDPPPRVGLAKDAPIEILEVGCGDVPLGPDIIKGISELERNEGTIAATQILKRVVCIDYSPSVIDVLNEQRKSDQESASVPLAYDCIDARKLPYGDGSFQFILEKGTMDAMLSDVNTGSDNCRAIVAEMARVLSVGGIIMVISHINAHTENGVDWLNSIVVPGLRTSSGWNKWSVEVHGSEFLHAEEEGSDGPGPAVYIVHKGEILEQTSTSDKIDFPTVSLRFFTY